MGLAADYSGEAARRALAMKTTMSRVAGVAIFSCLALSVLFAAATLPSLSATWNILNSDRLSISEVCRRWGEQPLDIAAFRAAEEDESTRATMACSLLKTRDDYVGMRHPEIGRLFGNFTGYYYAELHPTYLIEVAKTGEHDTWQIVFLIDRDGKVSEVFVHKNCC